MHKKSFAELCQERDRSLVQLHQAKRRLQRIDNRIAYLESGSRKQRAHHLITRGAAVESIAPEVKVLTEPEFYDLLERILTAPSVAQLIHNVVANHGTTVAADEHAEDGG